jgi:hypothetical protein
MMVDGVEYNKDVEQYFPNEIKYMIKEDEIELER